MTKKQRIATIVLGVAVIIVLSLIVFLEMQNRRAKQPGENVSTPSEIAGNAYVPDSNTATTRPNDWEENEFRQPVPVDIKVPEAGEELPAELVDKIAVPEHSIDIPVPGGANFRTFRVRAEGDKFLPEQVVVNYGDVVNIQLMAVDKDYDLVLTGYNMQLNATKGETRAFEFRALQDGRFLYYCNSCGGPESSAKGEIIVVK